MERLSGLDASFLYIESPTVPLHVCSVIDLDPSTIPGGYSFDQLRDDLATRVKALPELRAKLYDSDLNLDHPVWVEDKDFDVSRHVYRICLPSPGGRRELADMCGHLASVPLSRDKPLWEMCVIEGVADPDAPDGTALALMIKVHHAAVDGVSAANLLHQLCSPAPDSPPPAPVGGAGDATRWGIAAGGLLRYLFRPWQLAMAVPTTLWTIANTLNRARSGTAMAAPFNAPATRFNTEVTSERCIAVAQLDLDDVKRVKDRYGVKVNEVVLALCAGVLREYLHDRGELPDKPLVAVMPASAHETSSRPGRNQLSGMFCSLHTDIEDPSERLVAIAQSSSHAKGHKSAISATLIQDSTQLLSRTMFGYLMGLLAHTPLPHTAIHNVIISNVGGPRHTLYGLGAEVKGLYPLGPIFHGSGLNITVMSIGNKLNIGIISCPQLVDDLWDLADRFEKELGALVFSRAPSGG